MRQISSSSRYHVL